MEKMISRRGALALAPIAVTMAAVPAVASTATMNDDTFFALVAKQARTDAACNHALAQMDAAIEAAWAQFPDQSRQRVEREAAISAAGYDALTLEWETSVTANVAALRVVMAEPCNTVAGVLHKLRELNWEEDKEFALAIADLARITGEA